MIIRRPAGAGTILVLIVLAVSVIVFTGCQPGPLDTKTIDKKHTKKDKAHNLPPAEQAKMIKEAQAALAIVEQARGNSPKLAEALSGNALKNVRATMRKDAAAGKVRVRDWQNEKVEFKNLIGGVGGLSLQFDDLSYYVDAKTGKQLTKPQKAPFRFVLAMKKSDDRWKINGIYDWQAKDPKEPEKFRP